jgi:guanylate kinase
MSHSGAGKTEIAKILEGQGFRVIQSYTTRKPRYENEWGHLFCTVDEYHEFKNNGEIVAYSLFEGNHYFSTKEQMYNTDIYIVDPDGIEDLKSRIDDIEFITIYLKVDTGIRIERMKQRGDSIDKILKRVTEDGIKFQNKKYDYCVQNKDLDKAVKIISYITQVENGGDE